MASAAAAAPVSGREATRTRSASSGSPSPQTRAASDRLAATVNRDTPSRGNSAMPTRRKSTTGIQYRPPPHDPRSARPTPGAIPRKEASARLIRIGGTPPASTSCRSRPSTRRQPGCAAGAAPTKVRGNWRRRPGTAVRARPTRNGTATSTSLRPAIAVAVATASGIIGPASGIASVDMTRTSKPVRSSRSSSETISPRESSSMSNSSPPTAAMPRMPSTARPG